MKHLRSFLNLSAFGRMLSIFLALLISVMQTSCVGTPEQRMNQLSRIANLAFNVAVVSGKVTPTQAAIVKQAGRLIFEASTNREIKVEEVSTLIVASAVEAGAITPTQAEALAAAERVPLVPPTPALPTP
jgi:hypothetical protein